MRTPDRPKPNPLCAIGTAPSGEALKTPPQHHIENYMADKRYRAKVKALGLWIYENGLHILAHNEDEPLPDWYVDFLAVFYQDIGLEEMIQAHPELFLDRVPHLFEGDQSKYRGAA